MRVRVAQIGKPFGLAGEVTVRALTDEPAQRFAPGSRLALVDDSASGDTVADDVTRWLVVDRARGVGARWTLGFVGVPDRTSAETMRGCLLYAEVDPNVRPEDSEEWYDHQLVGLTTRSPSGATLGEVIAVDHLPAQDLLVVRTPSGAVSRVPFVAEIVTQVDQSGIIIDAPGGLFDDEGER